MKDAAGPPPIAWDETSGGVDWHLELARDLLLPATLVSGRVSISARGGINARGLLVALVGVEHWKHRETHADGRGSTTTVVTSRQELPREAIQVSGPLQLPPGGTFEQAFEMPVPPDGPASLEADDAGLDWSIEAKLDIADGFDSKIERPVTVAQPTALLRAGVVRLGELALSEGADVTADSVSGSITLRPAPLVCGEAFSGRVEIRGAAGMRLQEIRAELRVVVRATVAGGESQTITVWSGQLAAEAELTGDAGYDVAGTIPETPLPSIELPHGRTDATFHVILAKAWATDTHLERDVAIATTTEV